VCVCGGGGGGGGGKTGCWDGRSECGGWFRLLEEGQGEGGECELSEGCFTCHLAACVGACIYSQPRVHHCITNRPPIGVLLCAMPHLRPPTFIKNSSLLLLLLVVVVVVVVPLLSCLGLKVSRVADVSPSCGCWSPGASCGDGCGC
jgi:hypothetical protein